MTLGLKAVGRLLHELGIMPQKPLHRAYERDPITIEHWTRNEYPRLKIRATRRKAEIFFLDETGMRSDHVLAGPGKGKARRRKSPRAESGNQSIRAALFGMRYTLDGSMRRD